MFTATNPFSAAAANAVFPGASATVVGLISPALKPELVEELSSRPITVLAMDGTESEGVEAAARNAFHEAADEYASSEYRMDVAATLAKRCLERL